MTKGRALIEARIERGPATHVQNMDGHHDDGTVIRQHRYACAILDQVGGKIIGLGETWEEALADLRKVEPCETSR